MHHVRNPRHEEQRTSAGRSGSVRILACATATFRRLKRHPFEAQVLGDERVFPAGGTKPISSSGDAVAA